MLSSKTLVCCANMRVYVRTSTYPYGTQSARLSRGKSSSTLQRRIFDSNNALNSLPAYGATDLGFICAMRDHAQMLSAARPTKRPVLRTRSSCQTFSSYSRVSSAHAFLSCTTGRPHLSSSMQNTAPRAQVCPELCELFIYA